MQNIVQFFELFSPWSFALLGLFVGSFLNVVIHRLPRAMEHQWLSDASSCMEDPKVVGSVSGLSQDRSEQLALLAGELHQRLAATKAKGLVLERSECPSCGHKIRWYENIPVFSWIALRARCSSCKNPISAKYPVIELLSAGLFGLVALKHSDTVVVLAWCAAMAALLAMAVIDWETMLLPDELTLGLMWGGLLFSLTGLGIDLRDSVIGAIAGYLSLWTIYVIFKLLTGREGMGHGDFKLLAAIGAWMGVGSLPMVCVMASVAGVLAFVALKLQSRLSTQSPMPFGPFLAAGAAVMALMPITLPLF